MSNKTKHTIYNNGVDKTFVWDFENELRKSNNFNAPEGHVYELSKGDLPSKSFTEAYHSPNSVFLKAVGERLLKYFNKKKPIDYSKAAEKALKRYNKALVINVNFPYSYSYGYPGTHETYLFLGTLPDWPTQWPKEFVYGHESGHLIEPYYGNSEFLNKYLRKLLDLNTNTVVERDEKATKHDSQYTDKRADLQGVRALLYLMGLFNPSTDTEISMESIKKLREQYPDLRPIKQMDDETLYKLLNLVAYNLNKTKLNLQYAKEGVKLKYIKKFLIPAGAIENEDGTFWSDKEIEGKTILGTRLINTGQTELKPIGKKCLYYVNGKWKDCPNRESPPELGFYPWTLYTEGEEMKAPKNYYRYVPIRYLSFPIYKTEYLYKKDPGRIPIPDLYKEGLAEIKDGLTYYTFPKYTNEQVTQAIQELYGNSIPTLKLLYQDYTPDNKKSSILQSDTSNLQSLESSNQKVESPNQKVELTKTNVKDDNDSWINKIANLFSFSEPKGKGQTNEANDLVSKFKEYYAYPYEVALFYNISPEVYSLVLSYLESKYGNGENKLKEYIFTEKPLTYYKPGETFRDTVYTIVNPGGMEHYPLIRSTLDYKQDKISKPYNVTQDVIGDVDVSKYIPKIKDNKVEMPSEFSYYITTRNSQEPGLYPIYTMDYENMDLVEKEKFKQYLKNRWPDINFDKLGYNPFDYFHFKLTDSQNKKIEQILDENEKRLENLRNVFK